MPLDIDVSWFPRHTGTAGTVRVPDPATVADLLSQVGLAPDTVLVVRGTAPIPLDAPLANGDAVRIVHTMSGG